MNIRELQLFLHMFKVYFIYNIPLSIPLRIFLAKTQLIECFFLKKNIIIVTVHETQGVMMLLHAHNGSSQFFKINKAMATLKMPIS